MSGFLTSGRRTRFMPTKESHRLKVEANAPIESRVEPVVVREVAEYARGLLENETFGKVIEKLADQARETFETSALGPIGSERRSIAHMQIKALDLIVEGLEAMADDAKIYDKMEREAAEADQA